MRPLIVTLCLLLGCSGGDLTLPGSARQPGALRIVSGDEQRAEAGTLLDDPLVVQVVDAESRPIIGATVQFSFLGELPGADLDPSAVTTDAEGRAEAVVRLGSVEGEQLIVARVAGSAAPELSARFTVTALPERGRGNRGPGGGDDFDD